MTDPRVWDELTEEGWEDGWEAGNVERIQARGCQVGTLDRILVVGMGGPFVCLPRDLN